MPARQPRSKRKVKPPLSRPKAPASRIGYLNTDLYLKSDENLWPLVRALQRHNMYHLGVYNEKTYWQTALELEASARAPNGHILPMLKAIESLGKAAKARWERCSRREFNVGYECGDTPHMVGHGLSDRTLRRMADLGMSFGISIYSYTP